MQSALWTVVAAVGAAALALMVVQVVHRIVVRLGRRSPLWGEVARHTHRPVQLVCALFGVHLAVWQGPASGDWEPLVRHLLWIAVIGAVAWLVVGLVMVVEDVALVRFRTDVPDNRQARRAGRRGRRAGRAERAEQRLRRPAAAFSDAVRLDDVVVVEGEWGRIEELTLSYVVVQIWDDRRLILPTSYFTNTPFQNWTRSRSAVLGTVELDVDWTVPVPEMREELRRLLEGNPLWDGRVCVLQVTDATPDGNGRSDDDAKVFSGSRDGTVRASNFAGPDDVSSR